MSISVLDMFSVGIGPSSSHTVGPMRAARTFALRLCDQRLPMVERVEAHLYGSLALTGRGHGTDRAVLLGLEGDEPETVDVDAIPVRVDEILRDDHLLLAGNKRISFHDKEDLLFHRKETLPAHPNGMRFVAYTRNGDELANDLFYSVGGGFVVDEVTAISSDWAHSALSAPYPFRCGDDLLRMAAQTGLSISELAMCNETALRPQRETRESLLAIWEVMRTCVERGCHTDGMLPGPLNVARRAPRMYHELSEHPEVNLRDPLAILDWVSLWAMAVNEENAAGGRVVTAPTNGAAGIIPAVLCYLSKIRGVDDECIVRFLLTAGAIGAIYKMNASISGAEVGCQGEVGVACSMAAGALAEALGGTPAQVENAAEIGMEHNLGLTCDPVGGLVQVPCIERNAMAAIKAINAARLALSGDGSHRVPLDRVIATMRQTGADMSRKYKETARGGLAVNVIAC